MTPEEEALAAREAIGARDLPLALHHVAGALSADPLRLAFLEVCDALFEAVDDPVEFTTLDQRPWYGVVAVHARALARDGRHTEAIHLVLQVVTVRPDARYLSWAEAWLDAPAVAVDPEPLLPAIGRYLERYAEEPDHLRAIVPLLERVNASWKEPMAALFLAGVRARLLEGLEN